MFLTRRCSSTEDRLFDDSKSDHPARCKFGLAEIALKVCDLAISEHTLVCSFDETERKDWHTAWSIDLATFVQTCFCLNFLVP